MIDLEILLRFQNFFAKKVENDILITLSDPNDISLIWFANNARSNLTCLEKSMQCVSKVKGYFLLFQLQTSCTIYSLNDLSFSSLNSLTTSSFELEFWVANISKSVIIVVFVASLVLVYIVNAVLMFVIIRRYPAMLRGSNHNRKTKNLEYHDATEKTFERHHRVYEQKLRYHKTRKRTNISHPCHQHETR